jgi:Outer membrane protein beta-barrel domain
MCLIGTATIALAQSINFGIKAGGNLSTLTESGDPYVTNNKNLTGFHAGVIADIEFQRFSIQPGLFFIAKGATYPGKVVDNMGHVINENLTIKLNYLQLPVNLLYKLHAAPGVKAYFGAGPYLGYGLSASAVYPDLNGPIGTYSYRNISFGSAGYKNPDYGINFIAGLELKKRITIDLNYSLGLGNILRSSDFEMKNRSLGLSVGYFFR